MDAQTLSTAMGCSLSRATEMLPGMENAMRAANITTALRAAHWCSQIGHESAGLVYMEEIASGAAYEGRADLGNTQPGDGPRFKGSGPIQLTGRANFRSFTQWANQQGHTTLNFEARPELVRQEPKWGFLAASWYWTVARPNLNAQADRDDVVAVTKSINGGTNGIADRRARLARCKTLGTRLLPGKSPAPSKPKPLTPNPRHRGDPLFLPELLKAWGVKVKEMDAWRDRGEGDFTDIIGVMAHHTAGANTSAEYIAKNPGLSGGLSSQIHLARDGVATICGAGVAWHAGGNETATPSWAKGQVQIKTRHANKWQSLGNAKMIGIEAVNSGDGTQAWPEVQMDAYARCCAAICWHLGLPVSRVLAHKEFAPSRKIDPNFDMAAFRRRVQKHLDNPPTSQEDDMFTDNDRAMLRDLLTQATGNWKVGEFPGFDPFALAAKAREKLAASPPKGLTLAEMMALTLFEMRLAGDQLSGPGRTDKGTRTFGGWDLTSALEAARKKNFAGVTLVEGLAVLLVGADDDIAAVRRANKEEK